MKMMGSKFNKWLNNSTHKTGDNPEKKFFGFSFITTVIKDGPDEWECLSEGYDRVFEYKGKSYGINFYPDKIKEAFNWYNAAFDYKDKLLSDEELSDMESYEMAPYCISTLKMLNKIDIKDHELSYLVRRKDISVVQRNKLLLISSLQYLNIYCSDEALSIKQTIARIPEFTKEYILFLINAGYLTCEYKINALTQNDIKHIISISGMFVPDGVKKDVLIEKLTYLLSSKNDIRAYINNNYLSAVKIKLSSKARDILSNNDGIFYRYEDIFLKKHILQQNVEESYNAIISKWFEDYIINAGNIDCLKDFFLSNNTLYWRENLSVCRKLMIQELYYYVNCYQTKELLLTIKRDILLEKSLKKRTVYILDKLNHYFMDKEVNDDYNHFKHLGICPWGEAEKNIEELYSRDYAIRLFTLDEFKDLCYGVITSEMKFVTLRKKIYEKYFYFVQDALYRWNIMIDLDSYQLVIKEPLKINDPMRKLIKAIQKVK